MPKIPAWKLVLFVMFSGACISGARADGSSFACDEATTGAHFLIRGDFSDLGPLSCTLNLLSAQGATASLTNNLLTHQNSASADGLIALDYTWYNGHAPVLKGFSFGTYVQGDDTYQFQPTRTQSINGDTVTAGGFVEFDFFNGVAPLGGMDSFRVRGGQVSASTGTTSNSFVGEWIPNYGIGPYLNIDQPNQIGQSPVFYTFAPEVMVQYDHFENGPKTALLFASRIDAVRIGPEFILIFNFAKEYLSPDWLFLANYSVQFLNHESWDQYTGKEYNWSAVSMTYTFDAPKNLPHFGLTASYGFGNSEASGNLTKQFKLGLAVKL